MPATANAGTAGAASRRPLPARIQAIAVDGTFPEERYHSRSEARMAVITSAVSCGWTLEGAREAIMSGQWPGLPALYNGSLGQGGMFRRLAADWQAASCLLAARSARSTP